MLPIVLTLGLAALAGGFAVEVQAQPAITRYTVDGGGGTSQGGNTSISGTIGQPDAGVLSGGGYQIQGGFWVGASAGAPPTETPTPTPVPATPTSTPTVTAPGATPTRTPTSPTASSGLDVKPDPLDEFIDALDMLEWVSRTRNSAASPEVFFDLSVHWIRDYPAAGKTQGP